MSSFTPLDILYIVLSFCVLWLTIAIFWFFYQLAQVLKNVNDTVSDVRDKIHKMEIALTGIREKFDHASSLLGFGANTAVKAVEYVMDRKKEMMKKVLEKTMGEDELPSRKPAFKKKRT